MDIMAASMKDQYFGDVDLLHQRFTTQLRKLACRWHVHGSSLLTDLRPVCVAMCGSCRSCLPKWRCEFPPPGSLEEIGRETSHDVKRPNVVTTCQVELSNSVHVEAVEVVVSKCLVIGAVVCAAPGRGVSVPWNERAR